ncbi:peptidase [Thalassobaculum sp.]|uniref:HD domain-containing protein n=1 Tax=Thalassobaculum sp. TaxID=2022740 RepID=UPI0032EAAC24
MATIRDHVRFTDLKDASPEDIRMLARNEAEIQRTEMADHVLAQLRLMDGANAGFQVDRLQHSLQTATRAWRADPADEEMILCALLHDIGELMAPVDHPSFAAAIVRPYVSEENTWMVLMHGVFQGYYYWQHLGRDNTQREAYRGHPAFERTALFCERYDAPAFDPAYDTMPLEAFEPIVRRLLARPATFRPPQG